MQATQERPLIGIALASLGAREAITVGRAAADRMLPIINHAMGT